MSNIVQIAVNVSANGDFGIEAQLNSPGFKYILVEGDFGVGTIQITIKEPNGTFIPLLPVDPILFKGAYGFKGVNGAVLSGNLSGSGGGGSVNVWVTT